MDIPNYSLFQRLINLMWGSDGNVEIKPAGPNLFIIQLPNAAARDKVLEQGPWHIQNKPLTVRKWEPGMTSLNFDLSKIPQWIHLHNVPLELFTKLRLSYIASAIGKPLYMDRITAYKQRLSYAKLCVEIDMEMDIPWYIDVKMKDERLVSIEVEVSWHLQKCTGCLNFGHSTKSCSKKPAVEVKSASSGDNDKFKSPKENLVPLKTVKISDKLCSANRYVILDSEVENDLRKVESKIMEDFKVASKKARAASAGVAELMKSLKNNRK
ncbi:hypothetical protein DITRI_Ditri11bG0139900 [Diplodiscus trichospermus]